MKIFNKSVSLLLTLVMILSLFPTTIFAAPSMSNAGAGSVVITSNPSGGRKYNKKWNGDDVNSMWGYKVSVWFAPLDKNQPTGDNVDKKYKWGTGDEFQVGKTIYLRRQYLKSRDLKYGLSPDFWNSDSIYKQLELDYDWALNKKELKYNNFEYSCTKFITDYNNQQGIPLSASGPCAPSKAFSYGGSNIGGTHNGLYWVDSTGQKIRNNKYMTNKTTGETHWQSEWAVLKQNVAKPSHKGTEGEVSQDVYRFWVWDVENDCWTSNLW